MTNSILITNCSIGADDATLQKDRYIIIEDERIAATGPMKDLPSSTAATLIDGRDKLLLGGLINGHNHSAMTLFRGMADDLDLPVWLHKHIFPAEAKYVGAEMVYWCSKLAAAEMLLSGTTCVADGYFYADQAAEAFEAAGLRAVVAHGIIDFPAPGVPDPTKNIAQVEAFIRRWKNKTSTIRPAVFAHSPYTCSQHTLKRAKRLADSNDVRFFIHLAEGRNEQAMIAEPAGTSPVKHLKNLNILDSNCVCVHSIWLDDEDLDILAASEAQVILCPQSNFKLASGHARAADMAERGIPLGLGTDGCASNNSLDMFREMDIFAKSQKVRRQDPTIFPAHEVYRMTTGNNSRILGLDPPSLCRGSRADLILVDLKAPHLTPLYNLNLLVYGVRGSDIDCVIVNGRLVVRAKKILTFDLEETKQRVRALAEQLQDEIHCSAASPNDIFVTR